MTTDPDIIAMARTGMSYRAIAAKVGVSHATVRHRLSVYREAHPDSLPYRYPAVAETKRRCGSTAAWSAERDEHLANEWPLGTPWGDVLEALNAMDGPELEYHTMAMRAARLGIRRPPGTWARSLDAADSIFSQGCRWEDACDAAGLRFDDIPDPDASPPPRRGIMKGPPPNHAEMVAARVAMASQARMAVADVGVRGLV